jgi:nucleoside-diphosphate-sugar epimerase
MITGGTGFIGFHSATALLDAGHEVCLLVRSEEKMRGLYGDRISDFVVGDVTDEAKVREALHNCDGVIHTAAMVSIDKKDAQRVHDTNVGGTRLVIGNAVDMAVPHIIHVSSVTALFDPDASVLNEHSPPGTAENPYGRSKVECEFYVRELQERGAHIHITYPGSVIGPDDPALTEPHQGLKTYLAHILPVMPGGNQWVDVRDIATAHHTLLESDLAPGRYTLGGHYVTWAELADTLGRLTGRPGIKLPLPGTAMRGLGRLVDTINRLRMKPLDVPLTHEAMVYATRWVKMDDRLAETELGLTFRPLDDSLSDAIRSLVRAGHISPEMAGKLAQ